MPTCACARARVYMWKIDCLDDDLQWLAVARKLSIVGIAGDRFRCKRCTAAQRLTAAQSKSFDS
eukprot:m.39951 g.39951  ORF g.39951 m.39951 type:complete len:64 (-) comp13808_c1_seq1:2118-2309(-)